MNKLVKLVVLILIAFLLSGCDLFEQKEDIYILYTNDVAGTLVQGEVGYDGVSGYKKYLEAENNYVALVDAGDFFDGALDFPDGVNDVVRLMNACGYDVVTLGNQEFSIGLDNLALGISNSNFDYVSSNLKFIGKGSNPLSKVKPYVIKRFGWTKVAFVGVTTPETLIPGKPAYAAISQDGELIYDFYGDNDGADLYEQVQKTVDKVRKKVDYVIVLSHLGSNSVTEGFSSYDLINNTEGIDVVIDGHSHTVISGEAVANKNGDVVVLTSTGKCLENLGVLAMHPDHSYTTTLYPQIYEKDPEVTQIIEELYNKIKNG